MLKGCDRPDEFQEKSYMKKFLFEHFGHRKSYQTRGRGGGGGAVVKSLIEQKLNSDSSDKSEFRKFE